MNFICKKPAVEYRYHFAEEKLSWPDAKKSCEKWGGNLTSVIDEKQE
jgi:hypothetical protein